MPDERPTGPASRRAAALDALLRLAPPSWRPGLRLRARRLAHPARLGTLRRTTPLSDRWGLDRGTPVDRHYIEGFLAAHRGDIRGDVLELQDRLYTGRFGADVTRADVLDLDAANPRATVIADLGEVGSLPPDRYDCFVLTQTLQFVFDLRAALANARTTLRPGGVLLATVPALSRVDRALQDTDYWRFTAAACVRLFGAAFGEDRVAVHAFGNVLAGTAFLNGMAAEELSRGELAAYDPYFPVVIGIRAVKP